MVGVIPGDQAFPHSGADAERALQDSQVRRPVDARQGGVVREAVWAAGTGADPKVLHRITESVGEGLVRVVIRGVRHVFVIARGEGMPQGPPAAAVTAPKGRQCSPMLCQYAI